VAKEGGITRAADKLGMAVQTVSAQERELERSLGYALLKPAGRGLVLTDAGLAALQQADQIFQLGERLPDQVRDAVSAPSVRLAVGISDGLPKLVVHRLLQPVLSEPNLRLLCHEGEFDDLLGDLALHRLDVVLSDRPAPNNANINLYNHALGSSPMAWYGVNFILGVGLALAPIGAYIAVTGRFEVLPLLFSFAVLFWVSGFDIIYALQDDDFDKSLGLHSVPATLGRKGALLLSDFLHIISAGLIVFAGVYGDFGALYWIGALFFGGLIDRTRDLMNTGHPLLSVSKQIRAMSYALQVNWTMLDIVQLIL
jgi:hypothetical protein